MKKLLVLFVLLLHHTPSFAQNTFSKLYGNWREYGFACSPYLLDDNNIVFFYGFYDWNDATNKLRFS